MTETAADRLERLGTDPMKWAKEFVTKFNGNVVSDDGLFANNVDEDAMRRWFANAIAVGEANGSMSEEPKPADQARLKEVEERLTEARNALVSTGYWDTPSQVSEDVAKHIRELVIAHNSGTKSLVEDTHSLYVKWMARASMAEDTLMVIRLALEDHDRTVHRTKT